MALAVFSAGGPIGMMFALFASGFLDAWVGWRWTFVLMSVPGLLLAMVMLIKIRVIPEVRTSPSAARTQGSLTEAIRYLLGKPTFVSVNLLMATLIFLGFGQGQWIPAYFERSFSVSRAELGVTLAVTQGFGMLAGGILGGIVADRLMMRGSKWRAYYILATMFLSTPFAISVFLARDATTAAVLIGLESFLTALPVGALWASVQDAAPEEYRATGSAFTMMTGFVTGMGIGPVIIGAISDALHATYGIQSLRYALIITACAATVFMLVPFFILAADARRALLADRT